MTPSITPPKQNPIAPISSPYSIKFQTVRLKIESIYKSTLSELSHFMSKIKEKSTHVLSTLHSTPLTNVKIKQIFSGFASVYSFIGARAIAGGIFPTSAASFIAATPFVAISGALAFYAYSLVDYQNPNTLKEIQREAQMLPLAEVVKKHGWTNLFTCPILPPSDFETSYRLAANPLPFNGILELYEMVGKQLESAQKTAHLSSYTIPSPSEWKEKFRSEIKGLNPIDIAKNYSIEKLESFKMLSLDQLSILKEIKSLLKEGDTAKETFRNTVMTFVEEELAKNVKALQEANDNVAKIQAIQKEISSSQNNVPSVDMEVPETSREGFTAVVSQSRQTFEETQSSLDVAMGQLTTHFKTLSEASVLKQAPQEVAEEQTKKEIGRGDLLAKGWDFLRGNL